MFKLEKNQTDVKTEVMAGITTFMTMAIFWLSIPEFWVMRAWG